MKISKRTREQLRKLVVPLIVELVVELIVFLFHEGIVFLINLSRRKTGSNKEGS